MTAGPIAAEQPATFAFTPENLEKADALIAKYPAGRGQRGDGLARPGPTTA